MKQAVTIPMVVTFTDGKTETVCCGRAVAEAENVFGYVPQYDQRKEKECPNHPQPMTEGMRGFMKEDIRIMRGWFDARPVGNGRRNHAAS
jgi:hypothetical protein